MKNAPKNFPQLKFKTSRNHSHLRSWNQSTFPVFAEKLINKCLIMKIIAEKKEAGRVLKVENCGRVGNSDTREKKMAQFVRINNNRTLFSPLIGIYIHLGNGIIQ